MDDHVTAYLQIAFVVAIALGAGLFAFGGYLEPPLSATNPVEMMRVVQDRVRSDEHYIASAARGFGIGLMVLGGLGLVVPWVNMLLGRLAGRQTSVARQDSPDGPGA